jgi:Cu(I)/Ag(I) efflux system membrane fusion protein
VAARERLAPAIRTVGFVTAPEAGLVSVTLRFGGWVESLAVGETGRLVERGQVLAAVYSPELLSPQQLFLGALRWGSAAPAATPAQQGAGELERARQRLELLGIASQDIDALAKAGQPNLTVNVRSPVRGYVARKSALRGLFVPPGTELFQIADLSTVWVLADVYEGDAGRVKVGQRATVELAAYPGDRFAGRVRFVYPALSPASRTLQARLELENPGTRLRPGMTGEVTLELGEADAVVVPRDAVVDTGELQYVFVAEGGGRYAPRRVRTGWSGDGKIALLEGVREGERVVTAATFLLDSESRLRAAVHGGGAR